MNQLLSYCTARLFSRAIVPLAPFRAREVAPGNDNDPLHSAGIHRDGSTDPTMDPAFAINPLRMP